MKVIKTTDHFLDHFHHLHQNLLPTNKKTERPTKGTNHPHNQDLLHLAVKVEDLEIFLKVHPLHRELKSKRNKGNKKTRKMMIK